MRNPDPIQDLSTISSERLSVLQEAVDFFLGEQFDPKRDARFYQAAFGQAVHRHVRNPKFLCGFAHGVSVSLQSIVFFLIIHSPKNGMRGRLQTMLGNVGNDLVETAIVEKNVNNGNPADTTVSLGGTPK